MKVRGAPREGEKITTHGPFAPSPLEYQKNPRNDKILSGKKVPPKPAPHSDLPRKMSWGEVVRGEYPHGEVTICCTQGCRIHDIIVIVPVFSSGEAVGTALAHVGCLRKFLTTVPDDYDVVQEVVAAIKDRFVDVE